MGDKKALGRSEVGTAFQHEEQEMLCTFKPVVHGECPFGPQLEKFDVEGA
ncbi:hypothetical protein LAG90_18595 [Marinilongibacter aquaticus]|nr:hypothetical protein [Marinilongibacter aquaticus]UBM58810.1 hypothetical protein LAG90_18595 [Marinilongibacter aquaticus]